MTLSSAALGRLQAAAWIALVGVCAAVWLHAAFFSDDVPFVTAGNAGEWITVPVRPTADLIAVLPDDPPAWTFVHRFDGAAGLGSAPLRGRALRRVEIRLNGQPVDVPADGIGWKRPFEVDVAPLLRPDRNELRATVRNVHGPPLLQLALRLGDRRITTGDGWQVVGPRGEAVAAVPARDTRIHPESRLLPPAWRVATDRAPVLIGLFAAGAAATAFGAARLPAVARTRAPRLVLAAVTLFWVAIYALKAVRMPVALGFDAHAHLAYIDYLMEHAAPPTAAWGFSTYHPPVFHTLAAVGVAITGVTPGSPAGAAVYRLVPMAAGLATGWLTAGIARRLWPGESLRPALAAATAGLLPMNVYMATYVSNEALHATWVSAALWIATGWILARSGPSPGRVAALGGVLGLGLLTKFTSLATAPVIAAFAAARTWLVDGRGAARAAGVGLTVAAVAVVVSGWFYVRNWIVFGDPLVWNLDVPGAATWWMLPGFHTPAAYTQFGESLARPFFAGFASFWDGVYSTLWADGLVAGMVRVATRHPFWRYDYMTLVPALALPASALFAVGFGRLVVASLRDPDPARRLVLSMITVLPFVLAFSLLLVTLRLPFYAQAKAPYVLAAAAPLALCAAEGLGWAGRRLAAGRSPVARAGLALYGGWLTTLAGVIGLAFLG